MQKYLNILSKPIVAWSLKALIFIGVLLYVLTKIDTLHKKQIISHLWDVLSNQTGILLVPMALVLVNWGLEAWKWQVSVKPVEVISYKTAVVGVLSGLNIGVLLPQAFGDYAGRIWHLSADNRADAISSVFLCHFSQFFMTCLGGLTGAVLFYSHGLYVEYLQIVLYTALISIGLSVLGLLFFKQLIKSLLFKFPFLVNNYHYFKTVLELNPKLVLTIFGMSFLRYLCFLTQFVCVLTIFGFEASVFITAGGIMLVFFLKSIIPSFNFLADLGVREFSALAVFSVLQNHSIELQIISASLFIWLINLFIPSVLGIFTIFSLRISPSQHDRNT